MSSHNTRANTMFPLELLVKIGKCVRSVQHNLSLTCKVLHDELTYSRQEDLCCMAARDGDVERLKELLDRSYLTDNRLIDAVIECPLYDRELIDFVYIKFPDTRYWCNLAINANRLDIIKHLNPIPHMINWYIDTIPTKEMVDTLLDAGFKREPIIRELLVRNPSLYLSMESTLSSNHWIAALALPCLSTISALKKQNIPMLIEDITSIKAVIPVMEQVRDLITVDLLDVTGITEKDIQWLLDRGYDVIEKCAITAISEGNIPVLEKLRNNITGYSVGYVRDAVTLQWLVDNKCPAVEAGYYIDEECAQLLLRSNVIPDSSNIESAIEHYTTKTVKAMCKAYQGDDHLLICRTMAVNGRLSLLLWYDETYCKPSLLQCKDIMNYALASNRDCVIRYLDTLERIDSGKYAGIYKSPVVKKYIESRK